MCLAKSRGMGQQQQQRAKLTGVVYANAAAQLMKMIYVSSAHRANNTADIDLASSLYHDYVSLNFYQISNIVDDYFQGQIAFNKKLTRVKSVQSMQVLLVALEHSISFATYLAANFGCNRFRIMPKIVSIAFQAFLHHHL